MSITHLDRAYDAHARGELEEALQMATALYEKGNDRPNAALLLALCIRPVPPAVGLALTRSFIARGDLPRAVLAADCAKSTSSALEEIADAFAKDSSRLGDNTLQPPPLPAEGELELADASLDSLKEKAKKQLVSFAKDSTESSGSLPHHPLFSSLASKPLQDLLSAMERKSFAAGESVIEEGEIGEAAFVLARGRLKVKRSDGAILAELGPGAIFGEMALVTDAPRGASVVADEASQVLEMSRDALESAASRHPAIGTELSSFCRERMITNLMRHGALFAALPAAERSALIERFTEHHFEAGEALFEQGQEPGALYLIASGRVGVSHQEEGKAVELASLGAGDIVGEISLVLRRPANATVAAETEAVALELTRESFHEAIKEHPSILSELYEMATTRADETQSLVAQAVLDDEDILLL